MSNYQPHWDLSTIPDDLLHSEVGRRRRLKGPAITRQNVKPCTSCGKQLNATQRRTACPNCSYIHPRR